MYAESKNSPVGRPSLPARVPVAAALIWCSAFLASAAPWFGQLDAGALIAAFWTFEGSDYASVLAHYSWAPRVAIAVLIGFGLGLAGGLDVGHQRQVHEDALAAWLVVGKLTDRFKERQTFDVADRAADLTQHEIDLIFANAQEIFDLVGYMRHNLDRFAKIIAAPLFFENG